jgi:phage terminase large subunit-like protein
VPDAVETILVRNALSGEASQITFKAYSDGREAWQAETLDWVWYDEEPPPDIYTEGVTRTNNTCGPVFMTFTPLLGMSDIVMRYVGAPHPDRHVTNMTIDDVQHYSAEQKRIIIDAYPEHEREARSKGIPMLGSGRIFPVAEEALREAPLTQIPAHWRQLIGADFGWEHPTAFVHLAHDPDADCLHVTKVYRRNREVALIHAAAIKPWGTWIPVAWPRDALNHDKGGSCAQLCHQYRDHGLHMLSESAAFPDKRGYGVEAGVADMLERMRTGRFKVDANLADWWQEFRRYAVMMLRYALPLAWAPAPPDRYARRGASGNTTWMSA